MSRPLLITDCDEVLLHFIQPFHGWCDEIHGVEFHFDHPEFFANLRRKACGSLLEQKEAWALFTQFFDDEMHRQPMAEGAAQALATVAAHADVVVLTNLPHQYEQLRRHQLNGHDIPYPVFCNQGLKGPALQRILDQFQPSEALFIDDLAQHHASVAEVSPHVHRLHMVVEPRLAPHVPPAPAAHARIDNWAEALPWIMERLNLQSLGI